MKIKIKLTILFALIVALILIFFSATVFWLSSDYRQNEFYLRLNDKSLITAKLLLETKETTSELLRIIEHNSNRLLYEEHIQVFNSREEEIYNSNPSLKTGYDYPSLLKKIKHTKEVRFKQGEREAMGIMFPEDAPELIIISSALDKYGLSKLKNLKIALITGLFTSVVITILAGLFYSEQALRPISNVVKEVDKISIKNLNLRVNTGNGKDEMAQLAITFNKMLERIGSAFDMQKSFMSNASHELRTPLTALTGHIEVALMNKRTNEEYEQILSSLLDDIKNLNKLSHGLLELAQASLDISEIPVEKIRIDELLWQARSEVVKRNNNEILIDFEKLPDEEDKLIIEGNGQLLKTAFINLMDNACKFSGDKPVEVWIGFSESKTVLKFIDSGIGIGKEEVVRIFEPFYRAENARNIKGHGIGLSLAQKIFNVHNGTIEIKSLINNGTTVSVTFSKEKQNLM